MDHRPAGHDSVSIARALATLIAGSTVALLMILLPSPAVASGQVVTHQVTEAPNDVEASWSAADLSRAEPVEMPVPPEASFDLPRPGEATTSAATGDFPVSNPTAYPARLTGKVFFISGTNLYECSGTLVNSRSGSSVYTAGHCVYDTTTRSFVTDLVFAPGYSNGVAPYGLYPAKSLTTTSGWIEGRDFSYDVAVVTLAGTPETDLGEGRPIAFDLNPAARDYTLYGYPADPVPRYDGERQIGCRTRIVGRDVGLPRPLKAAPCDMGFGASGGGWITGGYLNSVTSYIYCKNSPELCGYVYGPYFSKAALRLYTSTSVGGSVNPGFRMTYRPPRKVTKRKVVFRFKGEGSTPIEYRCSFDRRRWEDCSARTSISRLTPGRHVLRVQAADQTGRRVAKTISAAFRVSASR